MKSFIIDIAKCNGCYNCQIVCKDEHVSNDWSPYAKPQPDTGQFWCKVNEYVRGTVPKVKMSYIPVLCMHCDDAPCIQSCPIEGGIYKRDDGLVIIDPKKCTGCMNCVDSCPFGCIYFNESICIAQKCTGCAHLLDRGWPIKEPRCSDACPTEAIKFGDEADFSDVIDKSELLHPEYGLNSRVHYLNLPKKFIAGTVYDPNKEEIIEGANCTLNGDGDSFSTTTNHFGDFWFENLNVGSYSLTIEAQGKTQVIDSINTEKDVNLGDIPVAST